MSQPQNPAPLVDERPKAPTPSLIHTPLALCLKAAAPALRPDPKRAETPRLVRREAVTHDEAVEAAQRAVPSLRGCTGVPRHVTADLDIVRGRGVVKALNHQAPAPDDPDYPWHGCAQRSLQRVRFPVSDTAGPVQVRLTLR